MTNRDVTVVVPTRNRRELLELTLRSVLAQEGVDVRVVVVDEGSSDETPAFLARLGDDRVSVIRHDVARGLPAARNAGLAAADSEWVAFVDDDDLWAPDKLAAQLDALAARPDCAWSCVSAVQVDQHLRPLGMERLSDARDLLRRLLAGNVIPGGGSGVVVRTAFLRDAGGFRTDLRAGEDWECWIRLAQRSAVAAVDRPLLAYRVWPSSMSHDTERMETAERRLRELHDVDVDAEAAERYMVRQELHSRRRRDAAGRLVRLARRTRRPMYLALAPFVIASPRVVASLRRLRWRATVERTWLAEAERWLRPLRASAAVRRDTSAPALACVAWTHAVGFDDLARDVGGDARAFSEGLSSSSPVIARYAVAAWRMGRYLQSRRPRVVVVTNPPIFAPMMVAGWAWLSRAQFVLDSHPGSFGLRERRWKLFVPVHRKLAQRASVTLVTSPGLADLVRRWGGRALVMHGAAPDWTVSPPSQPGSPPTILFVTTFDPDEPVAAIADASRELLDVDIRITGRLERLDPSVRERAGSSVTFTGWLGPREFRDAVDAADVIVCLTSDHESVMRAAIEAVYARRVLVHSDYPVARRYFPSAVFCANDAAGVVTGVRRALAEHERLRQGLEAAERAQRRRRSDQLCELLAIVGLDLALAKGAGGAGDNREADDEFR